MASPAPDVTIHDLETALRRSPLGKGIAPGQLADLFDTVRNKVLNLTEARTVVADVFRTQPLRVDEAITYATCAREMSAYDDRSAVVLATLLRDAAAMTLPAETDARTLVDLTYVRCWSIWLRRVPDGRIYREVAGIVDDLVRRCKVESGLHAHYGLALTSSAQLRSVFASFGDIDRRCRMELLSKVATQPATASERF